MKIISKYKDYYDFVAGYDTDPRKVYVRKQVQLQMARWATEVVGVYLADFCFLGTIWFCDQRYMYLEDLKTKSIYYCYYQIPGSIKNEFNKHNRLGWTTWSLETYFGIIPEKKKSWFATHAHDWEVTNLNKRMNIPVLFTRYSDKPTVGKYFENGKLSDLGFMQVKTPQLAFMELYNWIEYPEPKMPDDPTDMGRFENKGFDKKTSFRGK